MRKGKYRKAVFLLTYSKTKKGIEYLILKRKEHWKGWEFSKGGIEKGETKLQTVKRELHEESGLKPLNIKRFNYSGKYPYKKLLPDRPGYIGQTYSLYAVRVKKGRVSMDKSEHNGYKWVDFKTAEKKLTWPDQRKAMGIVHKWLEKN